MPSGAVHPNSNPCPSGVADTSPPTRARWLLDRPVKPGDDNASLAFVFLLVAMLRPAEMSQQVLLAFEERDAERIARPRQRDRDFAFHPSGMRRHHQHAVGEIDGLGDVVRDIDEGL